MQVYKEKEQMGQRGTVYSLERKGTLIDNVTAEAGREIATAKKISASKKRPDLHWDKR